MNCKNEYFLTSNDDIGLRLDNFLSKKLIDLSRTRIQEMISSGLVFFQDRPILKNSHKIMSENEEYKVIDEKSNENQNPQERNEIQDIKHMIYGFEDDDLLIINKPSGLLSQKKPEKHNSKEPSEISVSELALNYFQKNGSLAIDEFWEEGREFIVHRLDKETSGLMIIPKKLEVCDFLKNEFAERRVIKKYYGVVWGVPNPKIHRLEHEVRRDKVHRTKMMIVTNPKVLNKNSLIINQEENSEKKITKTAITNYHVKKILFNGAMSFVEFEIETGRTHQIRLQMSFFGFPVVFDKLYGGSLRHKSHLISKKNPQKFDDIFKSLKDFDEKRHLLHSHSISFNHPKTNELIQVDTKNDFSAEINEILKISEGFNSR